MIHNKIRYKHLHEPCAMTGKFHLRLRQTAVGVTEKISSAQQTFDVLGKYHQQIFDFKYPSHANNQYILY